MFHPLLQATSVIQGTPISVYVTIGAAVLAALASLNATRVSAKTSREVATLSSQTAKESARIASETAREIKDKEYKNDFYKKIIEKRLAIWSEAEAFVRYAASTINDNKYSKPRFEYFRHSDDFEKILDAVSEGAFRQAFWIGGNYIASIITFRDNLLYIHNESCIPGKFNENGKAQLDNDKLWELGAEYHGALSNIYVKMVKDLADQLADLHNIEGFLQSVKKL